MNGANSSRRTVLRSALGIVSVGTLSHGVAGTGYSTDGQTQSSVTIGYSEADSGVGSGWTDPYGAYQSIVVDVFGDSGDERGAVEFGGETGRTLRLRDEQTDSSLTFEPSSDSPARSISRFWLSSPPYLIDNGELEIKESDAEDTSILGGSYSGDTEVFKNRGVITATVELLDASGSPLATTESRPFGIGYPNQLEMDGSIVRVPIGSGVEEGWYPQVTVYSDYPQEVARLEMSYGPDGEFFEVDVAETDLDAGAYELQFLLYPDAEVAGDLNQAILRLSTVDIEWAGGQSGSASTASDPAEETSSGSGAGFGVAAAVSAIGGSAALASRHRAEDD